MTKTFFPDRAALMSPRTAKYVEAMVREDFDYDEWLKNVREEEDQAKQAEATETLGGLAFAQIVVPIKPFPNTALPLTAKTTLAQAVRRSQCRAKSKTPKARLRRWLEKVHYAWCEFHASRTRDAVYGYLEAVFAIVTHFRVRRRTKRLLRRAFEFANHPFDKKMNVFSVVIRCTSDRDIDSKTISKWSRALRFTAAAKKSRPSLKQFMKNMGGINACAARYARRPHKH